MLFVIFFDYRPPQVDFWFLRQFGMFQFYLHSIFVIFSFFDFRPPQVDIRFFGQFGIFQFFYLYWRRGWVFFISCLQKDFRKDPQVEQKFCRSLLTTKFVDVAPIGLVINIWNLSWWQQLCDVSKRRLDRIRRLLDQICMYCSKMNRRSCLYYQRIVHDIKSDWRYSLVERIQSAKRKVVGARPSLNNSVSRSTKICCLLFFDNNHIPKIQ